ncbi:MAG: HDOD domain-containing protein [Methylovulum sp.]|nr:MAG: HDOD domain-containing protein [Methylovulum sp.]
MSFLPSFFKNNKSASPASQLVSENITVGMLNDLIPIRNFSTEKLEAFATNLKSEMYPKGSILFRLGENTDSALYLLKGMITLSDDTGKAYEVNDGTAKARFPLSSGSKHTTTALAETDVSILRVSQNIMASRSASSNHFSQLIIPDDLADNRLLQTFAEHYANEKLEIPTLPDVAIKLRNAIQQDVGVNEAAKIIQMDPVMSAKLIELANCPLYVCSTPAKSCFEAINRIGLNATRNLVISLSIHHVFKSHSPLVKKFLDRIWKQSLYISTLSFVLAGLTKQAKPEEALLAGLVCDIGTVPFLHFADNLPKDYYTEADLMRSLACVKGPIGYKLLLEWGFSEEFIKIPVYSDDWYQNTSKELNLTDIVVLSRLHSAIGHTDMASLPVITSIPAASKLKNYSLSPEMSLNLLHNAKQQISDALKAFSN